MIVYWVIVTILFVISCSSTDSKLVYKTRGGYVSTRTLCELDLECTGSESDIFWTFFGGSKAQQLEDTDTRYSNITSYMSVGGETVTLSTLSFSPVIPEHHEIYICHIGDSSSISFNVNVEEDIIEFSEVKNINISSHKYGETVMMDLTLNTCLSVVSVSVYKGREKVFGTRISNNHQPSVKVSFPILVESESIGEYGVRAYAPEASTSLIHFNVTGSLPNT